MNIFSVILLMSAGINGFLTLYALRNRKSSLTLSYCGFMLGVTIYTFGYAFELTATTIESIMFWLHIEYAGIAFFPTFYLLFTLKFVGRESWIKPKLLWFLFAFSSFTFIFQLTNLGNLFYTHLGLRESNTLVLADFKKGAWYWLHQLYSNCVILICIVLYTLNLIKEKQAEYKVRTFILLLSATLPWPVYLYFLSGASPGGIDLNPFAFTIVGLLGTIGLFRYHLLDFMPLALENVFDSMRDGVIIIDTKKRIRSFNNAARNIFPQLNNKKLESSVYILFSNYNELKCLVKGEMNTSLDFNICLNKEEKFFKAGLSAVEDNQHRAIGHTIIFTDITQLKRTEKELIRNENRLKELNATKDRFFSIIAHDLRNPFNALLNISSILIEKINDDQKEEALSMAHFVYDSSKTTYELLQNLLEWSTVQRGGIRFNPELLMLRQLVDNEINTLGNIAVGKDIKLICLIPSDFVTWADSYMIKTVVRNLISNAIKFSYKGSDVLISAYRSENSIVVFIKDTGTGMNESDKEKLFRVDSNLSKTGTNNEEGTGLGLVLCKEFISIHNGNIWVESIEGQGSIFYFSIPDKV